MDLVKAEDKAVAVANAFLNARSALSSGQTKPICKFEKGDWYLGQDKEELPLGTKIALDMMNVEWGWVRWKLNKPVERRMFLVASGQSTPSREELGWMDEGLWDLDQNGEARDPWQFMVELPGREVAGDKRELMLSGGSRGWESACRKLFEDYGNAALANSGKIPVITLGGSKYSHPSYGVVKTPTLALSGWIGASGGNGEAKAVADKADSTPKKTRF